VLGAAAEGGADLRKQAWAHIIRVIRWRWLRAMRYGRLYYCLVRGCVCRFGLLKVVSGTVCMSRVCSQVSAHGPGMAWSCTGLGVVWCGLVRSGVEWCGVVWCGAVWPGVALLAPHLLAAGAAAARPSAAVVAAQRARLCARGPTAGAVLDGHHLGAAQRRGENLYDSRGRQQQQQQQW
jgi:hypothetical protein